MIESKIETINADDWEILTDTGWKSFKGMKKNDNVNSIKLIFDDGTELTCSLDHELLCTSGNFTFAQKARGKKIVSENSYKKVIGIKKVGKIDLYDVTDVDGGRYLTNGVVSHNCNMLTEFWGSVYPIISASKKSKIIAASTPRDTSGLFYKLYDGSLKGTNSWVSMTIPWYEVPGRDDKWKKETIGSLGDPKLFSREFECIFDQVGDSALDTELFEELKLLAREPMYVLDDGNYLLWANPNPDKIYVAGVDISEGVGKDYSVIQILDITDPMKIEQVALYSNNKIQPTHFTAKLREILQNWGDPLALVERNGCGGGVIDNLKKDYNYDNIVSWGAKASNTGTNKNSQLGIISHTNTKYKAIVNQRYWINTSKQVRLNDIQTINELKDFVKMKNGTFAAKSGSNDDRVMSLAWALMILSDDLVTNYFDIIDKDEYHKPRIIQQMDYGVKYFYNPTSIYTNEKNSIGGDAMPTFLGGGMESDNPEVDDLFNSGWKRLEY